VNNLHTFIGISQEHFDTRITKLMDEIISSGMKVDVALLKIDRSNLPDIEKMYCAYAIGRVVGIDEINKKSGGLAKRLGLTT